MSEITIIFCSMLFGAGIGFAICLVLCAAKIDDLEQAMKRSKINAGEENA